MRIVPALALAVLAAIPAAAQSEAVTVNSSGEGQTLIDPATGASRYVPPLLQPWQDDAIRLRPPGHHRAKQPSTTDTTAAIAPAPTHTAAPAPTRTITPTPTHTTAAVEPAPPPKPRRTAIIAPPVAAPVPAVPVPAAPKPAARKSASNAPSAGFPDVDLITNNGPQAPAARRVSPPPEPKRTASIEKPKPRIPSGTRKDSITFTAGASDPSTAAVSAVRALASSLNAAMNDGNSRVQLMAYAGTKGEKSSDTRRLSLKRALVIRQLLIDDGIPSERIDVFALGGADDDGALDRVDVFVKG